MSRGALGYGLPEYLSQTPLVVHPISRLSFLAKRTRSPRGRIMIGLSQPGYPVPHFPAFLVARVAMWPCPGQWDVSRRYLGALLIWKKKKKDKCLCHHLACLCPALNVNVVLGASAAILWPQRDKSPTSGWQLEKDGKRPGSDIALETLCQPSLPVSGFLIWWKTKTNPTVYAASGRGFFIQKHL